MIKNIRGNLSHDIAPETLEVQFDLLFRVIDLFFCKDSNNIQIKNKKSWYFQLLLVILCS